jgi:hypothetical protein
MTPCEHVRCNGVILIQAPSYAYGARIQLAIERRPTVEPAGPLVKRVRLSRMRAGPALYFRRAPSEPPVSHG